MGHARQLGLPYVSLHTHVLMESELEKSENIDQNSNSNTFQQDLDLEMADHSQVFPGWSLVN